MKKLLLLISVCLLLLSGYMSAQNIYLADPTIFSEDGSYYLYGTGAKDGFQVYISKDLKTWEGPKGATDGYALKKEDSFGTQGFWAPQVFRHKGKYYMAYTSDEQIAIASSDSPLGPFRQQNIAKLPSDVRQIDPYVFFDDDGKAYLYHVRLINGNRLFVAELNEDFTAIKPETLTECISAQESWEDTQHAEWPVSEGPTVLKKDGVYYFFYSTNDFRNIDYAVGYATSRSPYGLWKKYAGNPIISRQLLGRNGTGHGDLFKDDKGNLQYVYHVHYSNTEVAPRQTAVVTLKTAKGKGGETIFSILPETNFFPQMKSAATTEGIRKAPAPLFRDPITDGAADPVMVWNRQEKCWWILYTQRRANQETADVAYCYGNSIGIAESRDNGQNWVYRGTLDLNFERGHNTFWAPDVVYDKGTYHMFVAYIRGVRNHWGGQAHIVHFTSKNLWDWKYEGTPSFSSEKVIDGTLYKKPDGKWRIWYKDEMAGAHTMMAESDDLFNWSAAKEAIGGGAHEGPKVFRFKDYYWMLTDEWHGMRVYRSKDLDTWEKQGIILDKPSKRLEDTPSGAHGDVVVFEDKAYVIYFTHPGRKSHGEASLGPNGVVPYDLRRSSIQAAPLIFENGTLVCDRDADFDFYLPDLND